MTSSFLRVLARLAFASFKTPTLIGLVLMVIVAPGRGAGEPAVSPQASTTTEVNPATVLPERSTLLQETPPPTLARLSFHVPPGRMVEFAAAYAAQVVPVLTAHGLVASAERGRAT
ncbi:MAG: hypothetical protein HY709_01840, partial [Candidatus Latescibacteria bacterium]|nr:hypothetical protein [Candidatus Latescibacterota bacterium]